MCSPRCGRCSRGDAGATMTPAQSLAGEALTQAPAVLLVDDDEVNLLLTAIALRERGFDITESGGGEHALKLLADWAPDIIVLDAMMPGLDGFATCRRLRAMAGYENVPVLMLTGLDDDASITRAYQAGATDFFVKSNQWSLLAGRLQYLLRASRTRIELERSKAKLARAQDLARMGSFDWRRQGQPGGGGTLALSPEGLRVLGYGPSDAISLRAILRRVLLGERRSMLRLLQGVVVHSSVLATDVPVTLRDGRQRIIHVEAEPEFNEHGHSIGYTGIVQDVTDRRVAEDRIRHLANFDALTGLPNRRQLVWRMERAIEHARRLGHQCAFLLIDLDRFKIINDTLGHAAGDELLMEVALRLRACVRHSEQVMEGALEAAGSRAHRSLEAVGRLGGDEFIALLPEIGEDADAQRVAESHPRSHARPGAGRRPGVFRHRQRRHRHLPARRRLGGRPDAQLRRGHVLGQVAGQGRVGHLQPATGRARAREARAGKRAAQGHRTRRTGAALPAEDRRALGTHDRCRGADALAARRRARAAGRLHPAGRRVRPDRAAVRMGAARGRAPGAHLAGQLRLQRFDRREPAQPRVRALRPDRAHPPVHLALRHPAPRHPARDHRNRPDEGSADGDPVAAPAQRLRRGDFHRRLRHRLFVAGLPDDAADLGAEDRPLLRARPGRHAAELGRHHRHHRGGALARACASSARAWRTCARWKCCTAWAAA